MAKYLTKVEIGEQTITDVISDTEPYISNVALTLSSGMSALAIGGQASDMLRFTLNHSPTAFMDGEAVKFYVAQADVEEGNEAETIAETDETATELEVDTDDTGDDSAGETVTPEESAQAEAEQIQRINDAWNFFVPVEEQITATVTDELTEVGTGEGVDDIAEAEWILKGTYYVTQARSMNSGDTIDVTAMDALALLNDEFVPANRTASVTALYADLASQIQSVVPDLIVEDCDEPSDELITLPEGTVSYRQAFGYFAGLFGGYAQVSDDNVLQVEYYTASELPLLDSEVTGFTELSSGQIIIEQLTCDNENSNTPTGTHLIQSGNGEGLTFANPWQTQTTLDACLEKLKGLTFIGASVTAMWRPDLVSGCAVRVMTANEWLSWCMGMNEIEASTGDTTALKGSMLDLGRVVLTNYQTITFGDNAVTRIRSELRTTTERENQLVDNSVSDAYRFATDYIEEDNGTMRVTNPTGESIVIGAEEGRHVKINEDGIHLFVSGGAEGTNEIAHFGYGETQGEEETINAPYYNLGSRNTIYGIGQDSVVEGSYNSASGFASHAEGSSTYAFGIGSHSEGRYTEAGGDHSHAEGYWAVTGSDNQHAQGKFNIIDRVGKYADIVGNGTDQVNCSNAFALEWNGNGRYAGDVYVGCNADSSGGTKLAKITDIQQIGQITETSTEGNIALTASTAKAIASITLPKGKYVIQGNTRFNSISSAGTRLASISTNTTMNYNAYAEVYVPANTVSYVNVTRILEVTADNTTVNLLGYCSSAINCSYRYLKAIRVG